MKKSISKYSYFMLLGHAATDVSQGALPALLPFLIEARGYSYASAAGLVMAAGVVSAITQPIFGFLGDRSERPWFIPLGVLCAGLGISLVGWMESYAMTALCCVVIGVGVSLFHPEATKLANIAAGKNKGVGVSIFAVGGNIGFTGGPIFATLAVGFVGLRGSAFFIVPALVVCALLLPRLRELREIGHSYKKDLKERTDAGEDVADNVKGFTLTAFAVFFRAVTTTTLNMFIPLFWIGVFMTSAREGNLNLSVFAAAGIAATLAGGRVADMVGYRVIYRICCTAAAPLVFMLALTKSPLVGTVLVIFVSIMISAANSALMVTGQSFLPRHMGTASGILFGLTTSMGGLVAPFIGRIGDDFGLVPAMLAIACISVGALVFVWLIPRHKDVGRKR